jgi:hypothetical protein
VMAGALVVIAVPMWLQSGATSESVRTVPAGPRPAPVVATTSTTVLGRPAVTPSSVVPSGADRRSSQPTPAARPAPASDDAEGSLPAEEGCRAFSKPSGPLGPSEGPTECSYTATRPGGYEGGGTWTLEIRRAGKITYYDSASDPSCANPGIIQPGDSVTAHLGLRAPDGSYPYASAGSGEWHLTVGTYAGCF